MGNTNSSSRPHSRSNSEVRTENTSSPSLPSQFDTSTSLPSSPLSDRTARRSTNNNRSRRRQLFNFAPLLPASLVRAASRDSGFIRRNGSRDRNEVTQSNDDRERGNAGSVNSPVLERTHSGSNNQPLRVLHRLQSAHSLREQANAAGRVGASAVDVGSEDSWVDNAVPGAVADVQQERVEVAQHPHVREDVEVSDGTEGGLQEERSHALELETVSSNVAVPNASDLTIDSVHNNAVTVVNTTVVSQLAVNETLESSSVAPMDDIADDPMDVDEISEPISHINLDTAIEPDEEMPPLEAAESFISPDLEPLIPDLDDMPPLVPVDEEEIGNPRPMTTNLNDSTPMPSLQDTLESRIRRRLSIINARSAAPSAQRAYSSDDVPSFGRRAPSLPENILSNRRRSADLNSFGPSGGVGGAADFVSMLRSHHGAAGSRPPPPPMGFPPMPGLFSGFPSAGGAGRANGGLGTDGPIGRAFRSRSFGRNGGRFGAAGRQMRGGLRGDGPPGNGVPIMIIGIRAVPTSSLPPRASRNGAAANQTTQAFNADMAMAQGSDDTEGESRVRRRLFGEFADEDDDRDSIFTAPSTVPPLGDEEATNDEANATESGTGQNSEGGPSMSFVLYVITGSVSPRNAPPGGNGADAGGGAEHEASDASATTAQPPSPSDNRPSGFPDNLTLNDEPSTPHLPSDLPPPLTSLFDSLAQPPQPEHSDATTTDTPANPTPGEAGQPPRRGGSPEDAIAGMLLSLIGRALTRGPGAMGRPLNLGSEGGDGYEDLLRLAELIGPARPRNAERTDVEEQLPILVYNSSELEEKGGSEEVDSPATLVGADEEMADADADARDGKDVSMETGSLKLKDLLAATREKCTICLTPYSDGEELRVLKCRHGFHKECVDQWLCTYHNSCPICRGKGVQANAATNQSSISTTSGDETPANGDAATPAVEEGPGPGFDHFLRHALQGIFAREPPAMDRGTPTEDAPSGGNSNYDNNNGGPDAGGGTGGAGFPGGTIMFMFG
ncbi:hypothetical protein HK097_000033 [Rhizophlyctis rosea]|uniref:RING-type domain-containing protein n=1 Tax=Rhizophlyctis rosea TaxID=64517 RepID=A0AAD5SNJ8_9FUNG|nr:hypothetical protein HK097_000033 [Rhizophlyctis rosea]